MSSMQLFRRFAEIDLLRQEIARAQQDLLQLQHALALSDPDEKADLRKDLEGAHARMQFMTSDLTHRMHAAAAEARSQGIHYTAPIHVMDMPNEAPVTSRGGRWLWVWVLYADGSAKQQYLHLDCDMLTEDGRCVGCGSPDPTAARATAIA